MHAPVNGSEATNGKPDTNFTFTIGKVGQAAQPAAAFFGLAEPVLESWYVVREMSFVCAGIMVYTRARYSVQPRARTFAYPQCTIGN